MAVTSDILRTWTRPSAVIRDHLALGPREDRALVFLMAGCFVLFIARLPQFARTANETGLGIERDVAYGLFGTMFLLPLILYALALVSFVLTRPLLPALTPTSARLTLFWALLAASPAALFYGLVAGFIGPGSQMTLAGLIWVAAFGVFWLSGLIAAGRTQA
jgi:hypothetical protein